LKLLKGKRMDPAIAAGRLGLSGVRTSPCRAGERRAGFGGAVSGSLTLSGGGSTSGPCGRKKVSVRWAGFALSWGEDRRYRPELSRPSGPREDNASSCGESVPTPRYGDGASRLERASRVPWARSDHLSRWGRRRNGFISKQELACARGF